jgi:hypothetical protein
MNILRGDGDRVVAVLEVLVELAGDGAPGKVVFVAAQPCVAKCWHHDVHDVAGVLHVGRELANRRTLEARGAESQADEEAVAFRGIVRQDLAPEQGRVIESPGAPAQHASERRGIPFGFEDAHDTAVDRARCGPQPRFNLIGFRVPELEAESRDVAGNLQVPEPHGAPVVGREDGGILLE